MKTKLAAVVKKSDASLSLIASNLMAGKYQTKADLARIRASVGNAMKNSEKAFDDLIDPIKEAGRKGLADIANEEFDQACTDVAQAQIKAHILATILDKELEDAEATEPTEDIVEVDEEGNPVETAADADEEQPEVTDEVTEAPAADEVTDEVPAVEEAPEATDEVTEEPADKEDEEVTADLEDTDEASEAIDEFFNDDETDLDDLTDDIVEEEPTAEAKLKAVKTAKRKSTVAVSQDKAPLEGLFNFLS